VLEPRNHDELALDIRGRLRQGPVLLVFLSPSANLFPVDVKWYLPQTASGNLLRIQLPEEP
jgi:hypothetical protein